MSTASALPEDRVLAWLTELSHSETGRICLVNMSLCLQRSIVHEAQLKSFMTACLSSTSVDAEAKFHEACAHYNGSGLLFFGIAAIDKSRMPGDVQLSSTISTRNFHRYLL